jgi:serine/threonine protein kinase
MNQELSPDTTLSHYRILDKLGAGGMGEIYLAEDTRLHRKVALKLLPAEFTCQAERVHRFEQEARAASSLNHPNIVTIFEIGETNGTHFIATEFIEGETLREYLVHENPSVTAAIDIAIQTASALAAAHDAGILHRDIKPENLMVRRDGIVKVLDFGLAKLSEQRLAAVDSEAPTMGKVNTDPGTVLGTASYMSPEQARGLEVDARTDIFSLGIVFYELFAGRPPFEGVNALDVISAILQKEPAPFMQYQAEAPRELEHILGKALRKDREQRYQTARELLTDLKDLQEELAFAAKLKGSTDSGMRNPGSVVNREVPSAIHLQSAMERRTISSSESNGRIKRRNPGTLIALSLLILGGLGVAYAIYRAPWRAAPHSVPFQNVTLTRLTTEGDVEGVTVSPDGKYIAYSLEESGRRSLWTKHPTTASRVQIVPPAEALALNVSTFSPDGGYVYYTKVDEQNPQGALYRVPVLGGASKKILADVAQPISISPDGRQLAFERLRRTGTADEIFLASIDGTGERRLLELREPLWLVGGSTAWSPDGRLLAVGYGDGKAMVPAVVSVADGSLRPFTSRGWLFIGNIGWLADGSGVAFTAREQVLGALQIWQASYPRGNVRRITNDLNSYSAYSLSLTADASGIVAVQGDPVSNLWVAPDGDASGALTVTARKNVQEGHYALAWTPDGKLLYDTDANGKSSIWTVNVDGSDPKPLTDGAADDYAPQASPDGGTIIFGSRRTNLYEVWRMDADGGNLKQLTQETGVPTFSVSPDGRWVIYNPFIGGIRKVSIDGGPPVELIAAGDERNPQISPDGKLLAYFFNDEKTKRPKIVVINAQDGAPVKTFDLPVSSLDIYETGFSTLYRGFHWSPDGRGLVYINTLNAISNLWWQPLDGSAPRRITDFTSDLIYNFAYSLDGRRLAFARGSHNRDAVMISEIK